MQNYKKWNHFEQAIKNKFKGLLRIKKKGLFDLFYRQYFIDLSEDCTPLKAGGFSSGNVLTYCENT